MLYLLFVVGFILLIKGAGMLVEGASAIGRKFNISEMVIGLTVVSFGTSLPELLVTTVASMNGQAELGLGNILGSNIANILLILGIAALVRPLPIPRDTYFVEVPFSLLAVLLLGFLANSNLFEAGSNQISRFDGGILMYFFSLFMVYVYVISKSKIDNETDNTATLNMVKSVVWIVVGIGGLYFGGNWVVGGATEIATLFGLSESVIGLTILAIGTSLPELVTSAMAAWKNNTAMAVGNAIGSNIFNVLWIIGFTSIIRPLNFNPTSNLDILMILIASSLLIMAVIIGRQPRISRWEGFVFLLFYMTYMASLSLR